MEENSMLVFTGNKKYAQWVQELKHRYLSLRMRAALAASSAVLQFYWSLGEDIARMYSGREYGSKFFERLSIDLQRELPNVSGLSATSIKYAKYFYELYSKKIRLRSVDESTATDISLQSVDESLRKLFQIPWGHHQEIINKVKGDAKKAMFFVEQDIENNWSRDVLANFLKTDLYERQGKAVTNFAARLPQPQGELAQDITRDPYVFDFLSLDTKYRERELEDALVENITHFLLELGSGFSFLGRQYRMEVGGDEFFIDLLFYNVKIHAYTVIELKSQKFSPEQLGQLSFYVAAVDAQLKTEQDNPTIGLLICREKNNVVARYSLSKTDAPIGISEYQLSKLIPENYKSQLPTIEEIERGLENTFEKEEHNG